MGGYIRSQHINGQYLVREGDEPSFLVEILPTAMQQRSFDTIQRKVVPIFPSVLESHNPQSGIPAPHHAELFSNRRLFLWRCIDEDDKVLRGVINLKELAYDPPQAKAS